MFYRCIPKLTFVDNIMRDDSRRLIEITANNKTDSFEVKMLVVDDISSSIVVFGGAWNDGTKPFVCFYSNGNASSILTNRMLTAYSNQVASINTPGLTTFTMRRDGTSSTEEYSLYRNGTYVAKTNQSQRGTAGEYTGYIGGRPLVEATQYRNGEILHNWKPASLNGILGVYDTVDKIFTAVDGAYIYS